MMATGALGLTGCTTIETAQVDIEPLDVQSELTQIRQDMKTTPPDSAAVEMPAALTADLLSLTDIPTSNNYLDIEARGRPASQFFAELGRSQGINMLVDPAVNENITLSLRNVSLQQIMAALQDSYGYDFQKTSYGYRVAPSQISTQIYRLNYLNVDRSGQSRTEIGGDEANTLTTTFSSAASGGESNFWSAIENSLSGFVDNNDGNRSIVVNPQTGLLVVSATTSEHARIAQFLSDAQLILQKQVIIEAKIVEVVLDQEYSSGINWSFLNSSLLDDGSFGAGISGDALNGVDGSGGVFNLSLSVDDFTSVLELLDYQGDAQVLSSPRVSTVNNQKAVIKVGADEYFATVTSVTTETDDDDDTVTVTPSIEMEQFFSGIALDVTPQIAEDDNVTLHVRPTVTEVTEQTKTIEFDGEDYTLPVAYQNIRESDSIIRAKSGQIVVIGGLLQQTKDLSSAGLPGLEKIPGLRFLFAQDRESQLKSELVILLKPTVFDENTSTSDVDRLLDRFE